MTTPSSHTAVPATFVAAPYGDLQVVVAGEGTAATISATPVQRAM